MKLLLACVIVCPKKSFLTSSLRIIVLVGYVSYWIRFNLEKMITEKELCLHSFKIHVHLIIGRLFYTSRQVTVLNVTWLTYRTSKQELKVLRFMLSILVCFFGFAMFTSELFIESNIDNAFVPCTGRWSPWRRSGLATSFHTHLKVT